MKQSQKKSNRSLFKMTDPKFQVSFLLFTFGIGVLTTITSVVCLHLVISNISASVDDIRSLNWEQIERLIQGQIQFAWIMTIILAIVNLCAAAFLTFLFSTRVSGLIFRTTRTLEAWSEGQNVTAIQPRKGDFFEDLVVVVNKITQKPKS